MSSDLSVKFKDSIKVSDLLNDAESVLKELLMVSEVPKMMAYNLENKVRKPFEEEMFGQNKDYLLIGFEGYQDGVSVIISEVPLHLPYVTEDEAGKWAGISVGIKKSHIEFSLAASLAISLARMQNSDVIDDGCRWNKVFKQKPDEFMNVIRAKCELRDFSELSDILFGEEHSNDNTNEISE